MPTRKLWLLFLLIYFPSESAHAHEVDVHIKITDAAVDYLSVLDARFAEPSTVKRLKELLEEGTKSEDDYFMPKSSYFPLGRFFFHFLPELNDAGEFSGEYSVSISSCSSLSWAGLTSAPKDGCTATETGRSAVPGGSYEPSYTAKNDRTWSKAIEGRNSEEGWRTLGYLVHLLEDLTSPAHTRNDRHPYPVDPDPVERHTLSLYQSGKALPLTPDGGFINVDSAASLFQQLRDWTANNFFSLDTTGSPGPQVGRESDKYDKWIYGACLGSSDWPNISPQCVGNNRKIAVKSVKKREITIGGPKPVYDPDIVHAKVDEELAEIQIYELLPAAVKAVASFIRFYADQGAIVPGYSGGAVNVISKVDGSGWPSYGTTATNYSVVGPNGYGFSGGWVPEVLSNLTAGSYTVSYLGGGPANSVVTGIAPCSGGIPIIATGKSEIAFQSSQTAFVPTCTATVVAGQTLTFTINFQTVKPDLTIFLDDGPDPVVSGENITYMASVENAGNAPAVDVVVTGTFPPNSTFISCSASVGTCLNGIAQLGTLNAASDAAVTFVVKAPIVLSDAALVASASVTTTTVESSLTNNFVSATTAVKQAQTLGHGWRMSGYNGTRSNRSSVLGPSTTPVFSTLVAGTVGTLTRISGDGSLLFYDGNFLTLYSKFGGFKWTRPVGGIADVAIGPDGTVYTSTPNSLSAWSKDTGFPLWGEPLPVNTGNETSSLAIDKSGTVYMVTGASYVGPPSKLTAIRPDRSILWEVGGNFRGYSQFVLSTDETIGYILDVVGSTSLERGISTATGQNLYGASFLPRGNTYAYAPWDALYTAGSNGFTDFLLGCTATLQCNPVTENAQGIRTFVASNVIITTGANGNLTAIDSAGSLLWSVAYQLNSLISDRGNTLYGVLPTLNAVVAIDGLTGTEFWRRTFSVAPSSLLLGDDGALYIGVNDTLVRGVRQTATTGFSDNFDRLDGAVGNGWIDGPNNQGGDLAIQGQRLSTPGPNGEARISRPIDGTSPVTVSMDMTHANGFSGLLNRYVTDISVGDGATRYGLIFYRGDENHPNSAVILARNGLTITELPSTFQYGSAISARATFNPDGSIQGTVSGNGSSFPFSFPARSLDFAVSRISIGMGFPDGRSTVITNPTVDNVRICYPSSAPCN